MSKPMRIAIVGLGKAANDQHLPSVTASDEFELAATVSHRGECLNGLPHFPDIESLAASNVELDAVTICTPPQERHHVAQTAIASGWHVLLEKPPAATLAELRALCDAADNAEVSLFASWHAQYGDGVEPARQWLARHEIRGARVDWREDARVWHPGQEWLWRPGGFGVFDPGINALSIVTRILPRPISVDQAELFVPQNCATPIAAVVSCVSEDGFPVDMDMDLREEGPPSWDISVDTDEGELYLSEEGSRLSIAGADQLPERTDQHKEYVALYRRFADIIHAGVSDVDFSPLSLVEDIFQKARTAMVDPYIE